MNLRQSYLLKILILLGILSAGLALWRALSGLQSNALWNIVQNECVVHQRQDGKPTPCALVDEATGFVVFKDRKGVLQYLLMPSQKVTGIEDPSILSVQAPNYWVIAWQQRQWLTRLHRRPITDDNFVLTINSPHGRSQNQLHIHIDCVLPKLKQMIAAPDWQSLPSLRWGIWHTKVNGHFYRALWLTEQEWGQHNVFNLLAADLQKNQAMDAATISQKMGEHSLAILKPTGQMGFVVLDTERALNNRASAEEWMDHECSALTPDA